jgi:hypothetical protein
MANRKKGSKIRSRAKLQRRAKLRRAISAKRSKARKVAKTAKRTVAKAKPKRAPVKKAARKVNQPVTPVVETVAVEVIEQPVAVTEVEQTTSGELRDYVLSRLRQAGLAGWGDVGDRR